jgi:hypothetical protein
MDEIFLENNIFGIIRVVHSPREENDNKHFASINKYMLIYSRNSQLTKVGYYELTDDDINK